MRTVKTATAVSLIAIACTLQGCFEAKKPTAQKIDTNKNPIENKLTKPTVQTVPDVNTAEPQFYEYTVKKGDTLSEIAQRFKKRWIVYPQIARDSGIKDPNLIFPGDKLLIRRPVYE